MRMFLFYAYIYAEIIVMKARLNVTIEEDVLEKAKAYAEKKDVSISRLIEDYLKTIVRKPEGPTLLDVLDSLPTLETDIPEDFDFKKEYREERKEKYGF